MTSFSKGSGHIIDNAVDKVKPNINMLGLCMMNLVFRQVNCALTVTKDVNILF